MITLTLLHALCVELFGLRAHAYAAYLVIKTTLPCDLRNQMVTKVLSLFFVCVSLQVKPPPSLEFADEWEPLNYKKAGDHAAQKQNNNPT